jgi:mRNA-degrading endonuclease RelE of RelBE toxin-antitoxin system
LSVTNNIEFLKSYDKELREVSKKLYKVAQDYYTTRTNFAKNNCQVNKMLASLMLNENFFKYKNFGIEKLIIVLIKEALENNNIKAIRLIDDWELTRAKYKALDRAMEALKSEQMALMSIMKNTVEGEKFSNVT